MFFDYDHVLRLDHEGPLERGYLGIHIRVHAEVRRCGGIGALHIGTVTEMGGRQEATSYTSLCLQTVSCEQWGACEELQTKESPDWIRVCR